MARSQNPTLRELRAVYRLIGECRELGLDFHGWRQHLLREMRRLAHAAIGISAESLLVGKDGKVNLQRCGDDGWPTSTGRAIWQSYLTNGGHFRDPLTRRLVLGLPRGIFWREQLFGDLEWQRSDSYQRLFEPAQMHRPIFSAQPVPGVGLDWLVLSRQRCDQAFAARERTLIRLCHRELAPLVGTALCTASQPSVGELTSRLRQTLACLANGDSEKQAARRLDVSRSTIHEYTLQIYRHFRVASRAELLAQFVRRGGQRVIPTTSIQGGARGL